MKRIYHKNHELFFSRLAAQEMTPQRSWMQEEVVDASYGDYLFLLYTV